MLEGSRILILAPHTDDGELGAGGLIHRFASTAAQIDYVAFSTCQGSLPDGFAPDTLEQECRAATARLGIQAERVRCLDYRVRRFQERRQDILDDLIKLRQELVPDLVLAPSSFDVHQDHRVIHEEAARAFKAVTLLGYELPWNCRRFEFDLLLGLSAEDVTAKAEAMAAYRSQAHRPYAQAETLEATARYHGLKANTPYAEAFEVIRWIIR